jgi:hypothetical protein
LIPSPLFHSRIIGTGETIGDDDFVEFRLLYKGELLPCSNAHRRPKEKHKIRKAFHPQMRRLWSVNPNLRQLAEQGGFATAADRPDLYQASVLSPQLRFDLGLEAMGEKWSRIGYKFVPLVTEELVLRCSLDILILRPEERRFIFEQGDIDGQVKTLLDALSLPSNSGKTDGLPPGEDETPFFCLLEDDRLISEVRVAADQLLLLPDERQVRANDTFAVIHVKLNHRNPRTWDNYFG